MVEVADREEGAVVPQGVSCTETFACYYIRVRKDDKILTIKVNKNSLKVYEFRCGGE